MGTFSYLPGMNLATQSYEKLLLKLLKPSSLGGVDKLALQRLFNHISGVALSNVLLGNTTSDSYKP